MPLTASFSVCGQRVAQAALMKYCQEVLARGMAVGLQLGDHTTTAALQETISIFL